MREPNICEKGIWAMGKLLTNKSIEQAEAGAVPSSGLVNSLVKIEVIFEFQKKKHDKY